MKKEKQIKNVLKNFQEGFGNEARMTRQCTCNSKRQREFLGFQTELNPTRRTEICIIYRLLITCIIFASLHCTDILTLASKCLRDRTKIKGKKETHPSNLIFPELS